MSNSPSATADIIGFLLLLGFFGYLFQQARRAERPKADMLQTAIFNKVRTVPSRTDRVQVQDRPSVATVDERVGRVWVTSRVDWSRVRRSRDDAVGRVEVDIAGRCGGPRGRQVRGGDEVPPRLSGGAALLALVHECAVLCEGHHALHHVDGDVDVLLDGEGGFVVGLDGDAHLELEESARDALSVLVCRRPYPSWSSQPWHCRVTSRLRLAESSSVVCVLERRRWGHTLLVLRMIHCSTWWRAICGLPVGGDGVSGTRLTPRRGCPTVRQHPPCFFHVARRTLDAPQPHAELAHEVGRRVRGAHGDGKDVAGLHVKDLGPHHAAHLEEARVPHRPVGS